MTLFDSKRSYHPAVSHHMAETFRQQLGSGKALMVATLVYPGGETRFLGSTEPEEMDRAVKLRVAAGYRLVSRGEVRSK